MSTFTDKTLKCMECNQDFTYTVAEQELHQSLGYQNEPKRCNPCREAKRQRKGSGERRPTGAPGGGGEGGGGGPRPPRPERAERPERGGGGGDRDRGGDRGPRGGGGGSREPGGMQVSKEYHMAICAECGKEAQLPFKPQGDRPVFCGECFEKKRTAT